MLAGATLGRFLERLTAAVERIALNVERAVDLYEIEVEAALPGAFLPGEQYLAKWVVNADEGDTA